MNRKHISCDVCLDLIPLVVDHVASNDSKALVYEHIKACENCRAEFEGFGVITEDTVNDRKIISSIKKHLFFTGFTFIMTGALIGILISNSFAMFYNFLIMPIVGSCAYFVLKKKYYWAPVGIFMASYIWLLIQSIFDGAISQGFQVAVFFIPIFLSTIYAFLTILGIIIAALLKFALRKEERS
ncbi:zf-HC2 domain-containing protein [Alkaliphilus oremlandii]|uniref:Putative zinc-finger domain-containing protein n=1 Tax=Alkaliphilus oremlandii (strain OhILAs) TaxID=350688 RepID=A8MF07_ALKOO|nr:zf-HC2 domain-containing protein [Alkaliphilus oremlandii]ABW18486.1 conserved hypothetical protein [Alkaliphilus oremlandii OhILAs]